MRDIPTSPRVLQIRRKRRIHKIRLFLIFLLLLFLVIFGLSYFSFHKRVTLNNVIISGNSIVDEKEVKTHIENNIKGKYFHLFSKSNIFIYPRKQIYDDLMISFPRIKSLSIYREKSNILHVDIEERLGSYLYCGEDVPEDKNQIGENCYFLNNDGYIFDKAPYFSGDIYFKYYMSLPDSDLSLYGSQMIDQNRFHEIVRFIDGVMALSFKPIYLHVLDNGDVSLYLKGVGDNNPRILFKKDDDLLIILDNLSLAMKKPEFSKEITSKYSTLQYIDLRFKNKVVYKFE